jgi:hypothetical protein
VYSEDDPPWIYWVLRDLSADAFRCAGCQLQLDGLNELEIADVRTEFEKQVQKEYDDGDYGNDWRSRFAHRVLALLQPDMALTWVPDRGAGLKGIPKVFGQPLPGFPARAHDL